jgi:hypothetical protein
MKANKFFLGLALVGAILTACEKEQTPVATGEVSYVSVNLNYANQGTRAISEDDDFEFGIEAENAIKDVTFFFFDEDFAAYSIQVNGNVSYKTLTPTMNAGSGHVEEISNAMLVIEKSKQTPPSYILAVVNCPTELQASLSLAELQAKIGAYNKNGNYFIMANSVYKNEATGEAMYATPLTNANFAPTAADAVAEGTPVEVYVERTAVKVRVNNFAQDGNKIFSTGIKTADDKDIYAEVIGWHVTDVNNQAYLLKNINPAWTVDALGLTWNDAPKYRSYWATSVDAESDRHPHSGNVIAGHNMPFDYYYENTTATAANRSQLVVVAAFKTQEGSEYKDVTIAEWWGVKYTLEGLKTAVANSLASEIFIVTTEGDNTVYTSIDESYIDFKQVENTETDETGLEEGRYWSDAVLAAKGETGVTYADASKNPLTVAQVKEIFKTIRHAKIWKEKLGGYYYLDIEHFGAAEKTAQYGMVRNHLYDYTLTTVKGLGTPIYDGTQIIVPEKPEDEETYIAAKLNVQAWKVVTNSTVELQ